MNKAKIKYITLTLGCMLLMANNIKAITINQNVLNAWMSEEPLESKMSYLEAKNIIEATLGKTINEEQLLNESYTELTREAFARLIVNALRYEDLANKLQAKVSSFSDVIHYKGEIELVKQLGIMAGYEDNTFRPEVAMTKKEVGSIIERLHKRLEAPTKEIHSNYAIQSSSQMELIKNCTQVSFGWGEIRYDAALGSIVVATSNNPSGFNKPIGFEEPLYFTQANGVESYIMFYLEDKVISQGSLKGKTLSTVLFEDSVLRKNIIDSMVREAEAFDGITVDFENFRSADLKKGFNLFLLELKGALTAKQKKMNVAVPPNLYYKGYDYKTIGELADHIILMAHDYEAKSLTQEEMLSGFTITPVTPLSSVYETLKAITDKQTGVEDKSKIILQLSFGSSQWQLQDAMILNQKAYNPTYDKIFNRLQKQGTQSFYSELYHNPYATYVEGAVKNVIWYENSQSVQAKIDLAKLLDVQSISLWRLGTIPHYSASTSKDFGLDIVGSLQLNK
ncbi:hypothetical protein CS063_12860 [Sporanaerobium hydrogeniformans]|uniref:Uncharacterized protein n=1 Tax=Sporanaerobium hydrogeniformans TaxID=3072179 RepID=A0AC61D9H4_9FIRM|nr:glycosyl hydrolase family 18 protein [Sporanaerobium hydrogeniformans]PHV70029.1 hypothetical protein CS063_12860 [Sporanaerobium hydrogeniformans]